jgi:hypothetical protein
LIYLKAKTFLEAAYIIAASPEVDFYSTSIHFGNSQNRRQLNTRIKSPSKGPEHFNQLYSQREKHNGQPIEIKDLSLPLPFPSDALLRQHNLDLTIISHHTDPITIYADEFSPTLMLTCGAFVITSLTNGSEFK